MKNFILNSRDISRDSYVWNLLGSLILAFQSIMLLIVITRVLGLKEAGMFTFAYANANLFFIIGKYGMKPFQASDQKEQYSFTDYFISRILTTLVMILFAICYLLYLAKVNGYTSVKFNLCITICFFKIPDAFEDVLFGRLQQKERMDIGAKSMTLRALLVTCFFCVSIIIYQNLLWSSIFATLFSLATFIVQSSWVMPFLLDDNSGFHIKQVYDLIKNCFPLFLGSFLALYLSNTPKYSIDRILDDHYQACYGFLSTPILIISLLNGIIFNPIIPEMSNYWINRQLSLFVKKTFKQIIVIIIISLFCILCAYCFGTKVLSLMYKMELYNYKTELTILLIGGSLYGLSGLLSTLIIIIRFQKGIAFCYGIVSSIAILFSDNIVKKYQLRGAAILYTTLMGLLCILFIILFTIGILNRIKRDVQKR